MRGRRALKVAIAIVAVLLVLAACLLLLYWSQLAKPDPVLAGRRELTAKDLPPGLESASQEDLRSALDELLAESLPENMPEAWWSSSLSLEQCEEVRRLALYLDDHQAAVRSLLWLAHKFDSDYQPALALRYLLIAQDEAKEYGLDDEYANVLLQEGGCLDEAGLYEWADRCYDKAYHSFLAQDNGQRAIYALINSAMINFNRLPRYEMAVEQYAQCARLADKYGESPVRTLPGISLWGFALESAGRYEDAAPVFQRATEYAQETGDAVRVQRFLNMQADNAICLGNNAEAEALLTQAVALNSEVADDARDRYESYFKLATFYQSVRRRDDAVTVLNQALDDIEQRREAATGSQDEARMLARLDGAEFDALATFGYVMFDSRQLDKAVEYYERAAVLSDKTNAPFQSDRVDLQLAEAYKDLGRYQDALSQLDKAEEHSVARLGPTLAFNDVPAALLKGQIYNELGEIEPARKYIKQAAKACPPLYNVNNAVIYATIQRAFGDLATLEGQDDEALDYYQDSYDVLSEVASGFQWTTPLRYGLDREFVDSGEKLADQLEKHGRPKQSYAAIDRCKGVQLAQDYLVKGTPAPDQASRQLLNDYRTATTYLDTLRGAQLQLTGWSNMPAAWPYSAYWSMDKYPWRYRREYVRQVTSLRRELADKVAKAEAEADACRQRLRDGAPDIADIVDLKVTQVW